MPKTRTKRYRVDAGPITGPNISNMKLVESERNEKALPIYTYVFAHVRGYKPWPAQITQIVHEKRRDRYEVFFFGTWQ